MAKNLVIVESPAKAKTIEGYLGKDFKVLSSYGHVRDLPKGGVNIDVENNFKPTYKVSSDKKEVVATLKRETGKAETVWLATDDDREGEAISWHLYEALKLTPSNTKRIVFREITKTAITNAITTPREIDIDLVNAQQARRILDRLVGYELSPVLWKKIKPGLSAGRVQSVAVRLIVDREREVSSFDRISHYKVSALFNVEGKELKAELPDKFNTQEEAKQFVDDCVNAIFSIIDLQKKPAQRKPAAPFTTSTLQQEAGRKLGFSVAQTMTLAQRLYESGKITYMRTDSVNLSETALNAAQHEIEAQYGNDYSQRRKYNTKDANAQEAHEAIRPTDFTKHTVQGEYNEIRLYDLIWKRAIASQMSNAKLEKTEAIIGVSTRKEDLKARGEVITFEGFLKVYLESKDDDEDEDTKGMLPPLSVSQNLDLKVLNATEKFTKPSARYSEASLVKKLEDLGIGRPSTYAPTISTVQKRGYVVKETRDGKQRKFNQISLQNGTVKEIQNIENYGAEKNKLFPTDIAMIVNDFLVDNFPNVTNFSFTANIEKEFDTIAEGKLEWEKMLENFYQPFHDKVEKSEAIDRSSINTERILGKDPETGRTLLVRLAKFGPVAQIGTGEELAEDEKPKYANIPKDKMMGDITFEEAIELFKLPRTLGVFEDHEIITNIGRFGPYVKFDTSFISLPKDEDPMTVTLEKAIELIKAKQVADAPVAHYEELPVQKGVGRFGPFIKWNGIFINVNKKYDFDNLSNADIVQLIEDKKQKEIDKVIHNWDEEGIRVEKARWGRHNILKGKIKIELAKTVDAKALTLDEVKAMIEKKTPKKKKPVAKKKKVTAKKK